MTYAFGPLSVLVVEDSGSARTLLAGSLTNLGVGTVRTVSSASAAIEYLKNTRSIDGRRALNPGVDVLISECEMEPVDGLMLLRWVRQHRLSPNRFMRTSLMSGAMEWGRVEQGRKLGADAMFAKPFTMNKLENHLNGLIRNNRPYIHTEVYFGPDRRRQDQAANLSERRDDDISYEILGQGARPSTGWFQLPNYLEMIATGTARGDIPFHDLAEAHARLEPYSQDFSDWVMGDMALLSREFEMSRQKEGMGKTIGERDMRLFAVRRLATNLSRQGMVLDYPLIARIADSLLGVMDYAGLDRGRFERAVRAHIKAMETAAACKIGLPSSLEGKAILGEIRRATGLARDENRMVR